MVFVLNFLCLKLFQISFNLSNFFGGVKETDCDIVYKLDSVVWSSFYLSAIGIESWSIIRNIANFNSVH